MLINYVPQPTTGDRRWHAMGQRLEPLVEHYAIDRGSGPLVAHVTVAGQSFAFEVCGAGLTPQQVRARVLAGVARRLEERGQAF